MIWLCSLTSSNPCVNPGNPYWFLHFILPLAKASQPSVPLDFQLSGAERDSAPMFQHWPGSNFPTSLEVGCYLLFVGGYLLLLFLLWIAVRGVLTANLRTGNLCQMKQSIYSLLWFNKPEIHSPNITACIIMRYECNTYCGSSKHFLNVSHMVITMPQMYVLPAGE